MELYTIAELSKLANIPESTARYYRDRHPDYFHRTGKGHKKRYTEEALKALLLICEMIDKEQNRKEQIDQALQDKFTKQILIAEQGNSRTAEGQNSIQLMNTLTNTLREISDQKKEIQGLREEIKELRDYIKTPVLKRLFKRG